jgi:virulence-associated protein VagC
MANHSSANRFLMSPEKDSIMATTEIVNHGDEKFVRLPKDFSIAGSLVSIRREGLAIILEPVREDRQKWPVGFFESICINDPLFCRPNQGELPSVPSLDSTL